MKSMYASYCMGAGYTAPLVQDWFGAEATTTEDGPQQTGSPGSKTTSVPTLTQLTIVTQTSSGSGQSRATQGELLVLFALFSLVILQVQLSDLYPFHAAC